MFKNTLVLMAIFSIFGLQATQSVEEQAKEYFKKVASQFPSNKHHNYEKRMNYLLKKIALEQCKQEDNETSSQDLHGIEETAGIKNSLTPLNSNRFYDAVKKYGDRRFSMSFYLNSPDIFVEDIESKTLAHFNDGKIMSCSKSDREHLSYSLPQEFCHYMKRYMLDMIKDYQNNNKQS